MDWSGWATFGFVATVVLTSIMVASQLAGLSRMDLPLMLGTIFVESPDRARVVGFLVHLANGQVFALLYAAAFALIGRAGWLGVAESVARPSHLRTPRSISETVATRSASFLPPRR